MSFSIGIDLGTTNSCVATVEGDRPTVIVNAEGHRSTPSVISFKADGERLVGASARNASAMNPDRTVSSVKRHMGTNWRKTIDGKAYTPQELSSFILRKLRTDAGKYIGNDVVDAVITVPAYFNNMQRQATQDAGRIAGLNVLRIINEPTAAALAYGLNNGKAQKVMVYDLGGGTFDVSIIDIDDGVIQVMATAGDNHLGGDDFDKALATFLADDFQKKSGYDCRKDAAAWVRVLQAAEQAKKELSTASSTTVNLPFLAQGPQGPLHMETIVSRAQFEQLIRGFIDRTSGPVEQALYDAGIAASELGQVLLVGGSTRIPAVRDHVQKLTGKDPSCSINPDECVAQGAAIQANTLSNATNALAKRSQEILLLDVIPLSLAIETVGGVATRVIERNSTLPIHYSQTFTTAAAFQTKVEVHVLQGERPMAADNKTIGKFQLKGIKRAPAGVPKIDVSFDIDVNGILTVTARDQGTGKEQSITITDDERMSDAEINQAIADAEAYAEQDELRRTRMQILENAKLLVGEAESYLGEERKSMEKDDKKALRADILSLKKTLMKKSEKLTDSDYDGIQSSTDDLRRRLDDLQRG